jgi:hypothetical protein
MQQGCGEGNEFRVCHALLFLRGETVAEFEVLEIREESNAI